MTELDAAIEREAWRMLLNAAESHVEDAINEDPDVTDDAAFNQIRDRAMDLIRELREQHNAPWSDS